MSKSINMKLIYTPEELTKEKCEELCAKGVVSELIEALNEPELESSKLFTNVNIRDYETVLPDIRPALIRHDAEGTLMTILQHTSETEHDMTIYQILKMLRKFMDNLAAGNGTDPEFGPYMIGFLPVLAEILKTDEAARKSFETLGGIYVLVDLIQFDCFCDCYDKNALTNTPGSTEFRHWIINILIYKIWKNPKVNSILGTNSYFIHALMDMLECGIDKDKFVQSICQLLTYITHRTNHYVINQCRVVSCLIECAILSRNPIVVGHLLETVKNMVQDCSRNAVELVSNHGYVSFLFLLYMESPKIGSTYGRTELREEPHKSNIALAAGKVIRNVTYHSQVLIVREKLREINFTLLNMSKIYQSRNSSMEFVRCICVALFYFLWKSEEDQIQLLGQIKADAIRPLASMMVAGDETTQSYASLLFEMLIKHIKFNPLRPSQR